MTILANSSPSGWQPEWARYHRGPGEVHCGNLDRYFELTSVVVEDHGAARDTDLRPISTGLNRRPASRRTFGPTRGGGVTGVTARSSERVLWNE